MNYTTKHDNGFTYRHFSTKKCDTFWINVRIYIQISVSDSSGLAILHSHPLTVPGKPIPAILSFYQGIAKRFSFTEMDPRCVAFRNSL